jgi:TonB family protein
MMVLEIGLRASVVVLAALAVTVALRHRAAALRHWVIAAGIFAAAAVAPLGRALPAWDFPQEPASGFQSPAPLPRNAAPLPDSASTLGRALPAASSPAPFPFELVAASVWAGGFAASALMLLAAAARLIRLTARARPLTDARWLELSAELAARLGVRRPVALLATQLPGMVGTWGWARPCVLLPAHCESWPDARIRIVLGHELAHIRRHDWGIQIAAEIVRAVFWFSPFFWIACARLRRESEQACDDAVLEAGVPAAEYASHLLDIARTCRPALAGAALPIARPSTLEWRITAMLNTTLARKRPTARAVTLVVAVIVGVALSVASFRAKEQIAPMPLTGVLYDMTGGVLPGVAVVLEDAAGGRTTATTDRDGRFDLGVIAPGRYRLASTLPGFTSLNQDLRLEDDARQWTQTITMQVGTLTETVTVKEQRPSSGQAIARGPVRIGGNIRPPRKLVDVRPVYPQSMRDAGAEGIVPLGALIGADGQVSSVRVIGAHAHPDFAAAAADAVRQWRFSPTLLNGAAVEVFMNVTVRFSLED